MSSSGTVFLFDVDNTLLDNDRVTEDLQRYLEREVGHERRERYWAIFEQLRVELGYADYLGALQRYRMEYPRGFAPVNGFSFSDSLSVRRPAILECAPGDSPRQAVGACRQPVRRGCGLPAEKNRTLRII